MKNKILPVFLSALIATACSAFAETEKPSQPAKEDLSSFKTADDLWAHILEIQQGPKERPKTQQEAEKVLNELIANLDAATREFISRYPSDPRKWDAKLVRVS